MENYNNSNFGNQNRDAQNAEEFTDTNANFNQNIDSNDKQNANPALADMYNNRLDTDPNRYANFNTAELVDDVDDYDTDGETRDSAGDERNQYSQEDERRLESPSTTEDNEHSERSAPSEDSDKQQFFDGL